MAAVVEPATADADAVAELLEVVSRGFAAVVSCGMMTAGSWPVDAAWGGLVVAVLTGGPQPRVNLAPQFMLSTNASPVTQSLKDASSPEHTAPVELGFGIFALGLKPF